MQKKQQDGTHKSTEKKEWERRGCGQWEQKKWSTETREVQVKQNEKRCWLGCGRADVFKMFCELPAARAHRELVFTT